MSQAVSLLGGVALCVLGGLFWLMIGSLRDLSPRSGSWQGLPRVTTIMAWGCFIVGGILLLAALRAALLTAS